MIEGPVRPFDSLETVPGAANACRTNKIEVLPGTLGGRRSLLRTPLGAPRFVRLFYCKAQWMSMGIREFLEISTGKLKSPYRGSRKSLRGTSKIPTGDAACPLHVALAYVANEKRDEDCYPSDSYLAELTHFDNVSKSGMSGSQHRTRRVLASWRCQADRHVNRRYHATRRGRRGYDFLDLPSQTLPHYPFSSMQHSSFG